MKKSLFVILAVLMILTLALSACNPKTSDVEETTVEEVVEESEIDEVEISQTEPIQIKLWHHGGPENEADANREQVKRFNASQDAIEVEYVEQAGGATAGGGYNDAVSAAAMAGDLPCILDLDGPNLYNYAWAGYIIPLEDYMSDDLKDDLLPSLIDQGTYQGNIYAMGQYDSGLALVGRKSLLEKAGVRIPTSVDDAWTLAEFNEVLEKVQALDEVEYAIDMKMNYGAGEWFSYGFSPILQSWGADLIDRETYMTAEGVLNGPEAVAAMTWLQGVFENGYTTVSPPDDHEFVNGKAALGWVGHWMTTTYYEAFGDDMILIPMVDFGTGPATGMGSWAWSISSNCENPEAAWKYLEFSLQPEEILNITNVNGAVPGRFSSLEASDLYGEGARLDIFAQQLGTGVAVPRPITPGYPTITEAFYTAMDNIIKGADVQSELDIAVDKINLDIEDNEGYPQQ
ncbi:MAG: sugar ABC transporter substrate-binding protein [Anaerolineaceae bacterium]|nr:sugar ABC transporter substrate-binding protein [Anaerolineaceae bacterium]